MKLTLKENFGGSDIFLLTSVLIFGLASLCSFFRFDDFIFNYLSNHYPISWDDNFWIQRFTFLGKTWVPIWLTLVWYLSTGKQKPMLLILLSLLINTMIILPIKGIVMRPRPYQVLEFMKTGIEDTNFTHSLSFPSGDTASIVAVAAIIIYYVKWPSVISIFWAGLVLVACTGIGLLRVSTMAHFPSDVFAGAAFGFLSGWLAILIDRKWFTTKPLRIKFPFITATIILILMPVFYGISKDKYRLIIFLKTYGMFALCIIPCVLWRWKNYITSRKNE